MGNITPVWLFWLYCFFPSCPLVEQSHWSLRRMAQMTCFRARTVLLGVRTMGDIIYGEIIPPKGAWIGIFKPKRQNLYIAISPEILILRTSDLRSEFRPRKALRVWSAIAPKQTQHGWRPPSWKSRYDIIFQRRMFRFRRNSAAGCRIIRRWRGNGRDRNQK